MRENEQVPGLKGYEIKFLRLISDITDGSLVQIDSTGTKLDFIPGKLCGGDIEFDCSDDSSRSIMYYIEGIYPLCLFAGEKTIVNFEGYTDSDLDTSIEVFNVVTASLLKIFNVEVPPTITILRRSVYNHGLKVSQNLKQSGKLCFECEVNRTVTSIDLTEPGFVRRVRGIASTFRVSPQFSNRMVDSIRGIFNNFLPDVYVNTNSFMGKHTKDYTHPAYGVSLWAETTNSFFLSTSKICNIQRREPEAIGNIAASSLLHEIAQGGICDSSHQWLVVLLMCLTKDVSKARLGSLTEYTISFLRLVYIFFGVKFQAIASANINLKHEPDNLLEKEKNEFEKKGMSEKIERCYHSTIISCKGIGYENLARTAS